MSLMPIMTIHLGTHFENSSELKAIECNNPVSFDRKRQSRVVLITQIHLKGTLGNMEIRLYTLHFKKPTWNPF